MTPATSKTPFGGDPHLQSFQSNRPSAVGFAVNSPDLNTMNQKYEDNLTSLQSKREELGISTAEGIPRDMFDSRLNSKDR